MALVNIGQCCIFSIPLGCHAALPDRFLCCASVRVAEGLGSSPVETSDGVKNSLHSDCFFYPRLSALFQQRFFLLTMTFHTLLFGGTAFLHFSALYQEPSLYFSPSLVAFKTLIKLSNSSFDHHMHVLLSVSTKL